MIRDLRICDGNSLRRLDKSGIKERTLTYLILVRTYVIFISLLLIKVRCLIFSYGKGIDMFHEIVEYLFLFRLFFAISFC